MTRNQYGPDGIHSHYLQSGIFSKGDQSHWLPARALRCRGKSTNLSNSGWELYFLTNKLLTQFIKILKLNLGNLFILYGKTFYGGLLMNFRLLESETYGEFK